METSSESLRRDANPEVEIPCHRRDLENPAGIFL
jgi:hypothetical protein